MKLSRRSYGLGFILILLGSLLWPARTPGQEAKPGEGVT